MPLCMAGISHGSANGTRMAEDDALLEGGDLKGRELSVGVRFGLLLGNCGDIFGTDSARTKIDLIRAMNEPHLVFTRVWCAPGRMVVLSRLLKTLVCEVYVN